VTDPELKRAPRTALIDEATARLAARTAIARAVIDARVSRGWTQQQLANAASTRQSRISELESARENPTLETVERVAAALGLELALREATRAQPARVPEMTPCPTHYFAVDQLLETEMRGLNLTYVFSSSRHTGSRVSTLEPTLRIKIA
jgi:transcriptional regulator with XRE-family HTH domain